MTLILSDILAGHENSKVEFKRDTSNVQGIVKEFIAFANRTGGVIIIGVDDKTRDVVGVDDPQTVEQQLVQAISDLDRPITGPRRRRRHGSRQRQGGGDGPSASSSGTRPSGARDRRGGQRRHRPDQRRTSVVRPHAPGGPP
ncbi:helix-turn-helix domain-containing protein [Baekduia sp.]|uniref:AlbA family DNA-binding domain-containing protein n=1 Tax=Baekduia sp. TaxID=2600305 RepID=UPI0039C8A94E